MNLGDRSVDRNIVYKKCLRFGYEWATLDSFLRDPNIVLIGYQVNFNELAVGIFLFNQSCQTTLAIHANDFKDLYDGPIFTERASGSEECPGYCLLQYELCPCPAQCECAYVREIIQLINNWPKS